MIEITRKPTSFQMMSKGELLASMLTNFRDCYIFLHNTKELSVVENIMNEGFIFESQLSYSTDRVNPNEPIEISYFLFQRKDYGSYTVIIAIPKAIYEYYTSVSNIRCVDIEEVITAEKPYFGENDELIYTLSAKHILGYFDNKTSNFHLSRKWDPFFNNCLIRQGENK